MPHRSHAVAIQMKRAYVPASAGDGTRVLIDRLWPRGVRKEDAAIDLWLKEIAPSTELRQWFGHDPAKFGEFRERYTAEVRANGEALGKLRKLAARGPLTLVYSAKDSEHNDAVVLLEILGGA